MSVLLKAPTAFASGSPLKTYPAAGMNAGTKMFFDFSDVRTAPYANGAVAAASPLYDIFEGGTAAAVSASTSFNLTKVTKGLSWAGGGTGANTQYVNFGTDYRWNFDSNWVLHLWFTRTVNVTSSNGKIASRGANINSVLTTCTFTIDDSSSATVNNRIRFSVVATVPGSTSTPADNASVGLALNTPHLLTSEFNPSLGITQYIDGVKSGSTATLGSSALIKSASDIFAAYIKTGGVLHAAIAEDLAISGRTAATAAAAEWAIRQSQFT